MLGRALSYQVKLQKHIAAAAVDRVRDYLAHIITEWPDLTKCPIDRELLQQAMTLVQTKFTLNSAAKTISGLFVRRA